MGASAGSLDDPDQQQGEEGEQANEELEQQADKIADASDLQATVENLRAENEALRHENAELRHAPSKPQGNDGTNGSSSACSGCRLRAAVTAMGTTPDELARCIGVVEASLGEARRELSRKQLSNKRARYEQLHRAMEVGNDEVLLAEAVTAATAAGVDEEELEKARTKLEELRSMTPEQRAERENRELEAKRKKEAFLLVKKNIAEPLTAFLDGLDDTVRWQEWRDHAGRTLIKCAQELRATKAQEVLVARQASAPPPAASPRKPKTPTVAKEDTGSQATATLTETSRSTLSTKPSVLSDGAVAEMRQAAVDKQAKLNVRRDSVAVPLVRNLLDEPRASGEDEGDNMSIFYSVTGEDSMPLMHSARGSIAFADSMGLAGASRMSIGTASSSLESAALRAYARRSIKTEFTDVGLDRVGEDGQAQAEESDEPSESEDDPDDVCPPELEAELKPQAFRAVVKDDCEALNKVLERVKPKWWSKWENKAGKDLLTLSEERGSSRAYLLLGKTLDIIRETKREVFEEREAVWIFANGDVQPRRATVLEDTPAHVDNILVEFWDGSDPPEMVDRCSVRKGG